MKKTAQSDLQSAPKKTWSKPEIEVVTPVKRTAGGNPSPASEALGYSPTTAS